MHLEQSKKTLNDGSKIGDPGKTKFCWGEEEPRHTGVSAKDETETVSVSSDEMGV